MKEAIPVILGVSLMTIMVMLIISGISYFSERDKKQWYAFEYWLANSIYFFFTLLTAKMSPFLVALPTVLWVWRVRTIRNILTSIVKIDLDQYWHIWLLGCAYLISALFAYYNFSFPYYTFPQALAMFVILMTCLLKSRKHLKGNRLNIHHCLLFFTVFIIIAHSLDYPFFRYQIGLAGFGFAMVLFTNLMMAVVLPSVTIYELKQEQEQKLIELVREREELLKSQSKLSALGVMTAGLAHEINNPLGIILHRTNHIRNQVMKDNFQKEALVRNLDQIELNSERMTKIIQSLRKFSTNNKNDVMESKSIGEIVEETLSYCRERFRLASVEVIIDKYPDVSIECHPVNISQVLLNLLNNSFDAVSRQYNPWIHLSFIQGEETLKILITDSGEGIPKENRSKIMEPFFSTKASAGTGLGLPISRNIIEDHHGRLYYDESPINTTFVVELPYRQSPTLRSGRA